MHTPKLFLFSCSLALLAGSTHIVTASSNEDPYDLYYKDNGSQKLAKFLSPGKDGLLCGEHCIQQKLEKCNARQESFPPHLTIFKYGLIEKTEITLSALQLGKTPAKAFMLLFFDLPQLPKDLNRIIVSYLPLPWYYYLLLRSSTWRTVDASYKEALFADLSERSQTSGNPILCSTAIEYSIPITNTQKLEVFKDIIKKPDQILFSQIPRSKNLNKEGILIGQAEYNYRFIKNALSQP